MLIFLLGISLLLFLNSLLIIGVNRATYFSFHEGAPFQNSKMALWWIRYYSEMYLGDFWSKPVCTCVKCMASIYSLMYWPIILEYYVFSWHLIVIYVLYIPALSALTEWVDNKMLT